MKIEFRRLDTTDKDFEIEFSKCEAKFFEILSNSYQTYYGVEYHKKRVFESNSIIYLAYVDRFIVGVSYVKRNGRRGGTAIYPEVYRRQGLAENLIKLSLIDFPKQYSILSTNLEHSHKMLKLMEKLRFKHASTIEEIKSFAGNEVHLLSNFRLKNNYLIFDRSSERRDGLKREMLTLVYKT